MYYMMSFNPIDNLLMYWDEPTIAMDYAEHPLHNMVGRCGNQLNTQCRIIFRNIPHIDELNTGALLTFMKSSKTQTQQHSIFKVTTPKKLFLSSTAMVTALFHTSYDSAKITIQCKKLQPIAAKIRQYSDISTFKNASLLCKEALDSGFVQQG